MLTAELADQLRAAAETAEGDQQRLLAQAADRLVVCGGCAYCEHATRAARAQGP